jgi:hypothetical protein
MRAIGITENSESAAAKTAKEISLKPVVGAGF